MYNIFQLIKKNHLKIMIFLSLIFIFLGHIIITTIILFIMYLSLMDHQ